MIAHDILTSVAAVGLEVTVNDVIETDGTVEVCAVVFTPGGNCPILLRSHFHIVMGVQVYNSSSLY